MVVNSLVCVNNDGFGLLVNDFEDFIRSVSEGSSFDECISERLTRIVRRSNKIRLLLQSVHESLVGNPDLSQRLLTAFINNNNIQALCEEVVSPIDLLNDIDESIMTVLLELTEYLWGSLSTLKTLQAEYEISLDEHYRNYYNANEKNCPFCSLRKLINPSIKRAAYDHYLCQQYYPLSSFNINNLFPICDDCNNSPAKGNKPLIFPNVQFLPDSRRLAFYPYGENELINISISSSQFYSSQNEWTVTFECTQQDQVNTWCDVYMIDERYKYWIEDNFKSWLGHFYQYLEYNIPEDVDELRQYIYRYIEFGVHEKEPGGILEKPFWNHLLNDVDLDLLIQYFQESSFYN